MSDISFTTEKKGELHKSAKNVFSYKKMNAPLQFKHDEAAHTQIACRIVQAYGGHINYYRLVKLLYIVEREAISKLQQPAIGGHYFSMENGPMISETKNAVQTESFALWSKHLSKGNYKEATEVKLIAPAGTDDVPEAVLKIVDSVVAMTKKWKNDALKEYCHSFKEYEETSKGKSKPIAAERILEATGNKDKLEHIKSEAEIWAKFEAAIA